MSSPTLVNPDEVPVPTPAASAPAQVVIRGVSLRLDELLSPKLSDQAYLDELREQIALAEPFPHAVVEGWFNPVLLEMVAEEFDDLPRGDWSTQFNSYARVERSRTNARMGPASQLYFSVIHSSFFLGVLSYVSGVVDLVPDPHLFGGGLHETLVGGSFGIHVDFDRHPRTALNNELVFITYLNKGWQPEWNGALELWDSGQKQCVRTVEPEFGRSIIMTHGKSHFHGHSKPLAPPPGASRRSVAAYYYANRFAREDRRHAMLSKFLFSSKTDRRKELAKLFLPPILVAVFKRLVKR